jgi:Zn-dependent M28 family amino/carboxypeptidase
MNLRKTCQLVAVLCCLASCEVWAQTSELETPPDPAIVAALNEVSAQHVQASIEKLVSFGTRSTFSAQDASAIAAGHGIGAAREWIKSEFERYSRDCGGCLDVRLDAFSQRSLFHPLTSTPLANVYAVLKGTDPQAHSVLVTGHYDSRNTDDADGVNDAPGANDDASGTAVSLECARVLSKLKFPQTIIFLTVPGEEQGLYGSTHLAKIARQQGWRLDAVLNNDIVGGDTNSGQDAHVVRVFSEGIPQQADRLQLQLLRLLGGESDSRSRELARYINETGIVYDVGVKPLLVFRLDRYLRGGDHLAFNEQGFSAVRFTEYREEFTHQHQNVRTENGIVYGDKPEYVDFDYVARVARLNAATLASLASAPSAPARVTMNTTDLTNDSTLSWAASPDANDYEVVWRATSSPTWEHAQRVGPVTQATLKISKDNVIFGVRARDRAGHASMPTIATPDFGQATAVAGFLASHSSALVLLLVMVLVLIIIVLLIRLRRARRASTT